MNLIHEQGFKVVIDPTAGRQPTADINVDYDDIGLTILDKMSPMEWSHIDNHTFEIFLFVLTIVIVVVGVKIWF